jgi:hypothetical protein
VATQPSRWLRAAGRSRSANPANRQPCYINATRFFRFIAAAKLHHARGMNFKCERFAVGSLERFGSFRQLAHAGDIEWPEIVGVVSDFRSAGFASEIQPEVYFSYKQFPLYDPKIVIRAASDPPGPALANAVREELRAANPLLSSSKSERSTISQRPRLRSLDHRKVHFTAASQPLSPPCGWSAR